MKCAEETSSHCFGVKRSCVLTKHLSHFQVLKGYPPDIVHDIFEGVVPVELARCTDFKEIFFTRFSEPVDSEFSVQLG